MTMNRTEASPPRDDPDIELGRLLWLALVCAGLFIGLVFYVEGLQREPECSVAVADDCGHGKFCDDGVCVAGKPSCKEADPCGACNCSYPKECSEEGLCVTPPVTPDHPVCADAEAMAVLNDLLAKQKECDMRMAKCETKDLGRYLTSKANFNHVLTRFGEVFVLVFPEAKPAYHDLTRAPGWPDQKTLDHYLEVLRARKKDFREADHIIVLGRASQSKRPEQDAYWAQVRAVFVEELLEVLETESQAEGLVAKALEFAVGSEASLSLDTIAKLPQLRIIGPSSEIENKIYEASRRFKAGETIRNSAKLNAWLNRSVVVVAVPKCQGRIGT